jgi:choline dehydrogenase-like flavoprotein
LLRDLTVVAYYEQPEVREGLGYLPDPFIAGRAAERLERWGDDIAEHRRLLVTPDPLRPEVRAPVGDRSGSIRCGHELGPDTVRCDVVVVGSGAGGGVMAAELAEAGLSVIVLEEGDHHPTESFTTETTAMLRSLYRDGGTGATFGRAPIGFAEGRCVGGGTVVNGGMAFRASERTLDRWATACGDRSLRRGGLDGPYARVERFLSVGPPDPGSVGIDQLILRRGAERLGWRVIDDTRDHVHCAGCNVCTSGCPTGAKQSTLVSYLPRAMSFGASVWTGCRVDRVLMAGKRAVGVAGRASPPEPGDASRPFEVRADHVVVCAGAVQTPALLLRSGVRQPSGQLGRNLSLHPGAGVVALFDERVDGWRGAHQSLQVREFEDEGIILAAVNLPPSLTARAFPHVGDDLGNVMRDYGHMVTAGVLVEDTSIGRVRPLGGEGVAVTYRINDRDTGEVTRAVMLLSEALLAAGAHTIHLPFAGREPLHDMDDLRRARDVPVRASDTTLFTVHLMGTARVGVDPAWAVCDPFGTVHDTAGLTIADASLFPGPVGVNPMLTIMALATRAAGRMIDRW